MARLRVLGGAFDRDQRQVLPPAPGVHPLTSSEPHAAPVTERHYDEVGNVVSTKDALERVTTYQRDNLDRLIEIDLPEIDGDWRYGYDLVGNLLFETDPAGNTTHYYYDAQYRQTAVAAPLNDPLISSNCSSGLLPFNAPAVRPAMPLPGLSDAMFFCILAIDFSKVSVDLPDC